MFTEPSKNPIKDINTLISESKEGVSMLQSNTFSEFEDLSHFISKTKELEEFKKNYQEYLNYKEQLFGKGKKLSKQILESTPVPSSISDIITGYADLNFDNYMAMKEKETEKKD